MKTNDIKKGTRVQLRNGWFATVLDNARGNIRMCEVEGLVTEMGSVYAHDIVKVYPIGTVSPIRVEHTPAQEQLRDKLSAVGIW